jgi:kynurenine formamidase
MQQKEFYPEYTALTLSGATWITEYSQIGLVGIDYLSIGVLHEIGDVHRTLFKKVSRLRLATYH